jgi:hypothetical protein
LRISGIFIPPTKPTTFDRVVQPAMAPTTKLPSCSRKRRPARLAGSGASEVGA